MYRKWKCPDYFFHLRGGGHVIAAKIHLESKYFCSIDITSFFNSSSRSRVTRSLKKIIPYEHSRRIAKESTVKNHISGEHSHYIPFGYVQSPLLASICLNDSYLGAELRQCYKEPKVIVSVYMDDIIISSKEKNIANHWFEKILFAAEKSNFKINNSKLQPPKNEVIIFNFHLSNMSITVTKKRIIEFMMQYQKGNNACKVSIFQYIEKLNTQQSMIFKPI